VVSGQAVVGPSGGGESVDEMKEMLLGWIERDEEKLVDFFSRFIQAKSPNPPGDTTEAVGFICDFLDREKLPYKLVAPQPTMANVVGGFECASPGRHLVFNGHIDVYPVGDETWTHDPWSGAVANGRVWGRGACDMKAGTATSILTFAYLHRIQEKLKGRLTLTAVSDEETMGPWGARYLVEHNPEVLGDCLLNGEPSSPYSYRFGEKGLLWLAITIATPGAHGAYTHMSPSATKTAARLIADLEAVTSIEPHPPRSVAKVIEQIEEPTERAQGKGAYATVTSVTLNIGTIHGGLKVNMTPGQCVVEADIRLPVGVTKDDVMERVNEVLAGYPEVTSVEQLGHNEASSCDPYGEMARILRANVKALKGFEPSPILSIGATDARLWRWRGIPGYVYGPSPTHMASADEYVEIDEYLHTIRTHVLSAYDYLTLP